MVEENSLELQSSLEVWNQENFHLFYDEYCGLHFETTDQNSNNMASFSSTFLTFEAEHQYAMPSSTRAFLTVEAQSQLRCLDFQDDFTNQYSNSEMPAVEQIGIPGAHIQAPYEVSLSSHHLLSSLPASQNWPGDYGFSVSFNQQEKNTKGVAWMFSKMKDKLFVRKDASCPINFSVNTVLPDEFYVRAMALYSSPDQASKIVQRCVNHSMDELNRGRVEALHLIRCDSTMSSYEIDPRTCRHSVIVPFENPQVGQLFSTYIYKFACFGSCVGGPNRRPLMIVFTLERNNEVVGRRKIDVKICACPGRDRQSEEHQFSEVKMGRLPVGKRISEFALVSDSMEPSKRVVNPPAKKIKMSHSKDWPYNFMVGDYECYEFLKDMHKFFKICKAIKSMPRGLKRALIQRQQRKNEERDG